MDQASIVQVFKLILTGNQEYIKLYTKQIEELLCNPEFCKLLMIIADNQSEELNIRLFAVTQLDNAIQTYWDHKDNKQLNFQEQNKIEMRLGLVNAMIRSITIPKLYKTYKKIIYGIVQRQYEIEGPLFINYILPFLQNSQKYEEIFASCLILLNLFKVNEFSVDEDRKCLYTLIEQSFGYIQLLLSQLVENYNQNEQIPVLINVILKIFYTCINFELPEYFLNQNQFINSWLKVFLFIINSPMPPQLETITQNQMEIEQIQKHPLWKNKEKCGKIMQRFISKHANLRLNKKEIMQKFSDYYLNNYGGQFLISFKNIIFSSHQKFVTQKVLFFSLKYLQHCMKYPQMEQILNPDILKLIYEYCIPLLQFNKQDIQHWNEDPIEFIRREDDFTVILQCPKHCALDLINTYCEKQQLQTQAEANNAQQQQTKKKKKQKKPQIDVFPNMRSVLEFVWQSFQQGKNVFTNEVLNDNQIHGILWMVNYLHIPLMRDKEVKTKLEVFLENFVQPHFNSHKGYLRAMACQLYGQYGTIEFKNKNTIQIVIQNLCKCIQDNNLVIKMKAAISLNFFLFQEQARELIRPQLQIVLKTYLELMNEIDNEDLVNALEGLITHFQKEIQPFAYDLCKQLIIAFNKYLNDAQNAEEDDGDKELAASGCLEAIQNILSSGLTQELLVGLLDLLEPLFDMNMSEDTDYGFVDETLQILGVYVYKLQVIPEGLWEYFPVMCYMCIGLPKELNLDTYQFKSQSRKHLYEGIRTGWAAEFMDKMLPAFKNFIKKGGDQFLLRQDIFNNNYVQLIMATVDKIYVNNSQDTMDDIEETNVLQLLFAFIENFEGKINHLLPAIIQKALAHLNILTNQKQKCQFTNLNIINLCFFQNPTLSLQIIQGFKVESTFFAFLSEKGKLMKSDFDLQVLILGVTQLLSLGESLYNAGISNEQLVSLIKMLPQACQKVVKLRNDYEDEEEENEDLDDDFLGDDDDDSDYLKYDINYDSKILLIDEILMLEQTMISLQQNNQQFYHSLFNTLTQQEKEMIEKAIRDAKEDLDEQNTK